MSQAAETLRNSPTATVLIIGLCFTLYAIQLLFDLQLQALTLCPRLVVYLNEYYRIISSAMFHGGFMHIGMNMMSAAAICSLLEKRLGTLHVMFSIVCSIIFTAIVHIGFAFAASNILGNDNLFFQHSIGFSGVLFHLSVLESNLDQRSRSVFGFFSVPSFLYPWVLLVVLQMFMPNLSFVGHLSGICTGTLQLYGILDPFIVADKDVLRNMQDWRALKWLSSHPGFVPPPSDSTEIRHHDLSSLLRAIRRGAYALLRWLGYIVEAFQVIVFGRGRSLNSNIQLGGLTRTLSSGADTSDHHDDNDDWNGLPIVAEERQVTQQLV